MKKLFKNGSLVKAKVGEDQEREIETEVIGRSNDEYFVLDPDGKMSVSEADIGLYNIDPKFKHETISIASYSDITLLPNQSKVPKIAGGKTGDRCKYCNTERVWEEKTWPGERIELAQACENYPDCMDPAYKKTIVKSSIDKTKVEEMVRSEVNKAIENACLKGDGPKKIIWKMNKVQLAQIHDVVHNSFGPVLNRIKAGLKNILVVGPAGSGKTTLAKDISKALGLNFAAVSCSGGMPEFWLTGRATPNLSTGENIYQTSQFVDLYEKGGVFLLDEMDAADPNVMIIVNSAIANGELSLSGRAKNPIAKRHKDFYLIAAANTYGRGADMQYQGRNALDAATLDRFVGAVITVDYDKELEKSLVPEKQVRDAVWKMRSNVERLKLRRIVGTRALLSAAALVRSGETLDYALKALTVGWTSDEVSKVVK